MKLVWFRNDLRVGDHHALYHACTQQPQQGVLAVLVIAPKQWQKQDEAKCRVQFWLACAAKLRAQLQDLNIPLKVVRVATNAEIPRSLLALAQQQGVTELHFNREYAEYETLRDQQVEALFQQQGIACRSYESDLVFAPGTLLNQQGQPYKVFTPFSKAWRKAYLQNPTAPLPPPNPVAVPQAVSSDEIPTDLAYGFNHGADWQQDRWPAGAEAAHAKLQQFVQMSFANYKQQRDFPAQPATSSLSPYLTVGALTVRQCLAAVQALSEQPEWFDNAWVTELIWREFYRHLLVLFPQMNRLQPFKPEIETKLRWDDRPELFHAWCLGETGYAIIDAGMQQLNQTGWMHNRVRMITAAFLTKILRQDWRLGAEYFMQHLIDGDFASNLGGWQWSASVGADAAPYFRIFNPMRQAQRFDTQGDYVAHWLPELSGLNSLQQHDPLYAVPAGRPQPIVDYSLERTRSLEAYSG